MIYDRSPSVYPLFSCWFVSSNLKASVSLYIFSSSSGSTISFSVYRWVTFLDSESYSATIRPPNTGLFLSMHLSIQITSMAGTIAWKNAWNASVLFFFFDVVLSFAAVLFLFLCTLLAFYDLGFSIFLLNMNAFCWFFHCFENFPPRRLSHPITNCSSINNSYLSMSSCPLSLNIVADTDSPLKYVMSPSKFVLNRLISVEVLFNIFPLSCVYKEFSAYLLHRCEINHYF